MAKDDIQSFSIDHSKHKECELVGKDNNPLKEYFVQKTQEGNLWAFTASTTRDFNYAEIVGSAYCHDAFLETVDVSAPSSFDPRALNARRCGIGTMLSTLCMIDKDVNHGSGIALDLEGRFGSWSKRETRMTDAQIAELIEQVKNKCEKVVGLQMAAEQGGGNIYFLAALLAGYRKMIFYDKHEKNAWIWPEVPEAQSCYNENKLGCQDTDSYWYFCKEKETTGNPKTSCFRKSNPKCLKPNETVLCRIP